MAGEIFISYRRADRAWAELLHARLKAEGVEAWYDARVGAGEDWRIATARALEDSRIFVLLFSAEAARSTDIAKELAAATLEKKLIVPVRLENIAPKGAFLYELASRNWINAFDDTEAKLTELAKGLARMVQTGVRDESVLPFDRAERDHKSAARKRTVMAGMLAVLVAAGAAAAWLLWPAPRWTVESSRAFVSTLAPEDYPAFSPDGKTLAYSSGNAGDRKIHVRNVAGGDAVKVTSDLYDDVSPTWSADGARIAYVAQKKGMPCRIMVASVPAGGLREAGHCVQSDASQVTWQPGTSFLYYKDRISAFGTAIFRLDLETGAQAAITGQKRDDYFDDLHCSPDGKSLVYLQYTDTADRIVIRDLASGKEKTLGQITKSIGTVWPVSAVWSEDSKTVLVTASSGGEIMAYPADGRAGYRLYASAVPVGHLSAGNGGLLAFEVDAGRTNLARASLTPSAQPDVIDAANGTSFSPSFAPDGTLAFLSNRSGTNAVWTMKPGAPAKMLFDGGALSLFLVDFSPDGSRLFVAYTSAPGITYKILTADGASVSSLDMRNRAHAEPTWTPDSKSLVLTHQPSHDVSRIAVDGTAQRQFVAALPWEGVAVRADGTFAIRHDKKNMLWRIDNRARPVSEKYPDHFWPPMAFRGSDVLIPDFSADGVPRILAQGLAGGSDHVIAYAPGIEDRGYLGKMAVNPKTGEIVYAASVQRDTNINLLRLTRH